MAQEEAGGNFPCSPSIKQPHWCGPGEGLGFPEAEAGEDGLSRVGWFPFGREPRASGSNG